MSNIFEKFDLKNKVAIVTGGVGLLGNQFCRTLTQAGASVVVADINFQAAQTLAAELNESGGDAIPFELDVTDPISTANMAKTAIEKFGRIDILVNSAALDPKFDKENEDKQGANAFESFPLDVWKQSLDVNLTGLFLCSQAVAPTMKSQGKGSIINICSTYGLVGPDQRLYEREGQPKQFKPITYTVTKAGVVGLTKYLSTYFAGTEIRINSLTPGGVYNNHDEIFTDAYSSRTVMGRMAEQDEMNGALLFLASDASTYMTGSNLIVDGGWTAW
jgi:NAD(P)-dependent dehydrogenase (short-subunit alcohol dehydrogenase family)